MNSLDLIQLESLILLAAILSYPGKSKTVVSKTKKIEFD